MRAGLLSLLLLVACGADEPDPAAGPAAPIVLRTATGLDVSDLRRIETVAQADAGQLEGAGRVEGSWRVLDEQGPRRVTWRGTFDLKSFHRVRLELRADGGERLRVAFLADGAPVVLLDAPRLEPGERTLLLDLPADADGLADELLLIFGGEAPSAGLARVALERIPQARRVPAAGVEPVEVDRVTRPARGLFSGRDLVADLRAGVGGVLSFAIASPGAGEVRVELTLGGEDHELVALGARWVHVRVPVPEDASSLRLRVAGPHAVAVTQPVQARAPDDRTTVLLITSDTHRADHLGAAGGGVDIDTPHLDALAARGVLFEDALSATNITTPSHASLLTGVHPLAHGVVDNETRLAAAAPTLAEAFAAQGWATLAAVSASHLSPARSGLDQGFDAVAAPGVGESDDFDAPARLTALAEEQGARPLFAWLHLFDAHAPYLPRPSTARYWDEQRDPRASSLPRPSRPVRWAPDVRDLEYLVALYRGEVSALDARLSAVLGHARFEGALIAFTADHGEHLGVEDGFFNHLSLDAENLHVPLLLAGPGVPVAQRCAAPVESLNLGRTLLDLAGLVGVDFPGTNLLGALEQAPTTARFAYARHGQSVSIERDGWLFVRHLKDQTGQPAPYDYALDSTGLYHLPSDPAARRDRRDEEPELALELEAALAAFQARTHDLGWAVGQETSAAQRAELEGLGYGGGEDD